MAQRKEAEVVEEEVEVVNDILLTTFIISDHVRVRFVLGERWWLGDGP